ncbi:GNAT family N-acetyltransferase [Nocardioides sp.]|uniref:GNAT family N-acetyltransferase n=1 Tax=Nocardioides sp. TaxID=35761 RepID=UPI0035697902
MSELLSGLPAALPTEIRTLRLRLPLVTPDEAADMLAGRRHPAWHAEYPRTDDVDAASMVRAGQTWGPRHIVRAFDGLVVGGVGFFGPPDEAVDGAAPEAEVGYGLVSDARGHGAATEALKGLLVESDRLGVRVRASVDPSNRASVRVLAKAGFTELRGTDDQGQLVMARPVPTPP